MKMNKLYRLFTVAERVALESGNDTYRDNADTEAEAFRGWVSDMKRQGLL